MSALKDLQGDPERGLGAMENTYKGIPMFCDLNLHESSFSYLKDMPKDSRILVLGSGSGAFDQRLVDHGFRHVTSVDFRPDFFKARGTNFVERDLNHDFSDLGTYDAVIAIELIEHLENPAHFFRNCTACLAQHGILLVTTPNIESGPSRASFLMQRSLSFFTELDLKGSGHITLLPEHIFSFHAHNSGLIIANHASNRNAWAARFSSNLKEISANITRPFHAAAVLTKTMVLLLLSPLTLLKKTNGNIHIYVLRKP